MFDADAAAALDDDALPRRDHRPRGRRTRLPDHRRRPPQPRRRHAAIIDAAGAAIDRIGDYDEPLELDAATLRAAVIALRDSDRADGLDEPTIALFDRMLRHSNHHGKGEVLQAPPDDDRLRGGRFAVLIAARGSFGRRAPAAAWLEKYQGTPAYEAARRSVGTPSAPDDDGGDDEDMN